ncbi:hypothetical protein GCM10011348_08670 [Marinobacterium nitratireducens]|uniref:Bacterioferritin-associated ferredoxin n=1 Tax=Marinobacterium nitratireducens TaxID=518897 RepID=A0A917Z979_9GAMM|nr:(2Fe-2S)-binding protein [Marinobacterium nitratireducens]GGO77949.1 hypothetical protein GCM10011348_08670 [Marinobacterium nitratireducens]
MKICICNNVSDSEIRAAIENGAQTMRDLREELCVGTECGKCACAAKRILRSHTFEDLATEVIAA